MNKIKSNLQNMVLVLTGSALICGGLLAYINNLTKPTIEAQAEKTLNEGISAVLGGNAGERLEEPTTVKRTVDGKEQTFVVYKMQNGTAVQSTDPNAFGGNLKVLVGFNTEGDILGYTVLEHAETPGLGAKAGEWFQKGQPGCIVGLNPGEKNLTVSKDGGDIDAITASTITSRSFLRAVQQAHLTFKSNTDANTSATAQKKCDSTCNEKED
ncbi:MAG: RnfABCDGE type electron transport complex subunit G [Prevotellaceae bacterium]|nr:RnfABCDGE type electron transport complex subunit G [Prevotellaceae bacterium]MDY2749807.1 RnfABCDGE type electron transport complex subunit G [Prevotella sp.]